MLHAFSADGRLGLNLHAYCNNNPVISVDPTGLNPGTDLGPIPGGRSGQLINYSSGSVTVWFDRVELINGSWAHRRGRLDVPPGYGTVTTELDVDYIPHYTNGRLTKWAHIGPWFLTDPARAYDSPLGPGLDVQAAEIFLGFSSINRGAGQMNGPTALGNDRIWNMSTQHAINAGLIVPIYNRPQSTFRPSYFYNPWK